MRLNMAKYSNSIESFFAYYAKQSQSEIEKVVDFEKEIISVLTPNEIIAKIPIVRLLNVKNWGKNRPPDEKRVDEILTTIREGKYVDGLIYLFEHGKYGQVLCYDGNHRLNAFVKLIKESNSEKDYDDIFVHVNIVLCATEENIKSRYFIINQSNPVPSLYLDDPLEDVACQKREQLRVEIEDCVKRLQNKFSIMFTSSSRPQKPHTNRDKLIDQLFQYCIEKNKDHTSDSLFESLIKLNDSYSRGHHIDTTNIPKRAIEKSQKYKCFLFLKNCTIDL